MSKYKKEPKQEKEKLVITDRQLKAVANQIEEDGNIEKFLIKQNAIRLGQNGEWIVRKFEGLALTLKKSTIGHYFTTDIPYFYWQEVIDELIKTEKKVEYKEWKEKGRLAKVAESMTIDL